ncbi:MULTISPECIES: mechanosensitive ion channel family protein [unclassified Rhizobium]|uniref:mechanosensitive ion channel family protein n=1 Tax=unclassified Rhizobium TaxID=2613769 RepID=UPI00178546A4|nr:MULTISPECIES: mechanosensitive ion channel family protein [unclassified Rhizobium]MBD8687217.1 mechanosensitive ion channel family protein [Rhizobium sp. CFBP 13644]MBD8690980.1 mechanosensitive ion channel family protein [Rhizobium sp. CFBP 13717]
MKWISALLLFLSITVGAVAQDAPRPQKVDDLINLLQDPEVRTWLEKAPATTATASNPDDGLAAWEATARGRINGILEAIPRIPGEAMVAATRTRADALSHSGLPVFVVFIVLTGIGMLVERLFVHWRKGRQRLQERLLAIGVFAVAAAAVFFAFDWPPLPRIVLLVALLALAAYRLAAAVLDAASLVAPARRRAKIFMAMTFFGIAAATLGRPLMVDPLVTQAVSFCVSVILLGLAIEGVFSTSVWPLRTRIALCLAFVVVWLLWCVGLRGLFWLGVYAIALPSALRFVGHAAGEATASDRGSIKGVLFVRGIRAIVVVMAVAWLALVWRLDPNSLVHSDPAVSAISYGLLKSVVVLLLADLAWHLVKSWIDRKLLVRGEQLPDASQAARQARLRTLLPIFRNVLAVAVAVVAGLIVLSELGVEIGPLIAGAGIFGVALGFGSQTLVKDVIAGIFYMFDDAFRVGEYIQAKSYKGTVEGFSLRSVRLRHHRGPVYTVPFGELGAVQNMSRDWGIVKFRISVSYDADVEKARKLTKKIGAALAEDPEFSPLFIEPLKMKGVEEFGDYGMVLSFGMTLRPSGLQSMIRRRANLMIREAFKENGIEFATPSVQVGNEDRDGAAAAATAIRTQQAKAVVTEG